MCNPFKALSRAVGLNDDTLGFDRKPDGSAPAPAAPAPTPVDPSIAAGEANAEQAKRDARRRGRASTIISGALGDPNFGQNVGGAGLQATFLGG